MSNINSQAQSFLMASAVQELSNETAAAVQGGGRALEVFRHANFGDKLGEFDWGSSKLNSNANNQISSMVIHRGSWRFYDGYYYTFRLGELGPGRYSFVENVGIRNDAISSIRRVKP
jgi:hypothetical protein